MGSEEGKQYIMVKAQTWNMMICSSEGGMLCSALSLPN